MTGTTNDLIEQIRALAGRDEEMCFYFYPRYVSRHAGPWGPEEVREAEWWVSVGNTSSHVLIGESDAKHRTEAPTLDQALSKMVELLQPKSET